MKRQDKYKDTRTFHFHNANPKNKITGDCVIRAICTATERPYNDVYEDLFNFSVKCGLILNDKKCYEKYLESQGWKKYPQPRKADGTKYTGREWCKRLQEDIDWATNGESLKRCIAHIGGHHIVAIINGKVYDHWDSTDGCIGNYWMEV